MITTKYISIISFTLREGIILDTNSVRQLLTDTSISEKVMDIAGLFGIRYMEEQNREHIDDWYVVEDQVGEIQHYEKHRDYTQYSEYYYTYVPYGDGKKKRIKIFDDAMIDALEQDKNAYIIFNYRGTPVYVYSTKLYNYVGDRLQTE